MSILARTDIARRFEGIFQPKWLAAFVLAALVSFAFSGQASAETRSLKLYFIHTKERAEIVYKRNGRYDQAGIKQINRFLRDWRRNEPANMDPRLLDLVWEVYRSVGARDHIHVVSAYRSPATNAMLRGRSSGVAQKSQHMLGKAMDFYIPGVPLSKLRAAAFKAEGGGVGFYPKSGSPFVHLDVGNVRSWPRMNRNELMALFPDGRTMHLPADGKPLPGYQQALAAYKSRQRSGATIQIASADPSPAASGNRSGRGLLATLFGAGGGGADEEEDGAEMAGSGRAAPPAAVSQPPAAAAPRRAEAPEAIIAALPAREVPLPGVAPRPLVDIGAPASAPLVPGLPSNAAQPPVAEPVQEVAIAVPLPTRRPDYTPPVEAATQVAAAETPGEQLPISAIAGNAPRSAGSSAITELLAMSASEARADVVINPPVPMLRPRLANDVEGSRQVAAIETANDGGQVFALASLPDPDVPLAAREEGQITVRRSLDMAEQNRVASLSATPRVAVLGREAGSDAVAALDSGIRTTSKAAKPRAGEGRAQARAVAVPVEQELTRWAFRRDVTVSSAGGTTEPATAHAMVRSAPSTVYTTGFQKGVPAVRADQFTGKAVTFMSVARFATN